jgi:general secretion pathway protein C
MALSDLPDLPDFFTSKWGKWTAIIVSAAILCLILAQLFKLYHIFSKPITQETMPLEQASITKADNNNEIVNAHLFGQYVPKDLNGQDIKKSLLNLKVVGIMLAQPGKFSQVILASPNGKQKVYRLGDTLPGGAKIKKIVENGILIEHNGQLESLQMQKESLTFDPLPSRLNVEQE